MRARRWSGTSGTGAALLTAVSRNTCAAAPDSLRTAAMNSEYYDVMNVEGGRHVKMWTRGVPIEDEAKRQLSNTARMPFIFRHVAAMPDVHLGIGATVGSVVATKGAIIPACVGVDIGCGMMA